MELKAYKSGDEAQILDLFLEAFKKPLSADFWHWRFGNNPFLEKPMIDLMWEGDTLAGHYAVSATELCVDDQVHLFSLSGTTMTGPGFEGRGIFSTLALNLYDRVKQDHNVYGVMGFPNKNSHYALVKKIRWQDVNVIANFSINSSKLEDREIEGMEIIDEFNQQHVDFIGQSIKDLGFSVYVNRSLTYLNWRYIQCPINEYHCFQYTKNGAIAGVIITKSFNSFEHAGSKEADILEIFCAPDGQIIKEMLTGVKHFYAKREIAIRQMNAWISIMDPRHLEMEKFGFTIGTPLTFFCTKAFGPGLEQIYDYRNWYISLGDSDLF